MRRLCSVLAVLSMLGMECRAEPPPAPPAGYTARIPRDFPPPAERYTDPDPSAHAVIVVPRHKLDLMAQLDRLAQGPADNWRAHVQRGFERAPRGQTDGMREDYAIALAQTEGRPADTRTVLWSYGWALQVNGKHAEALVEWRKAELAHGGRPFWVPYTYAVALWSANRKDEALAYYEAAVRSEPEKWSTEAGVARWTLHWGPLERGSIDEIHAAWSARRGTTSPPMPR